MGLRLVDSAKFEGTRTPECKAPTPVSYIERYAFTRLQRVLMGLVYEGPMIAARRLGKMKAGKKVELSDLTADDFDIVDLALYRRTKRADATLAERGAQEHEKGHYTRMLAEYVNLILEQIEEQETVTQSGVLASANSGKG